eukprot:1721160-Pleurochrysis_carterae.AAC.2
MELHGNRKAALSNSVDELRLQEVEQLALSEIQSLLQVGLLENSVSHVHEIGALAVILQSLMAHFEFYLPIEHGRPKAKNIDGKVLSEMALWLP